MSVKKSAKRSKNTEHYKKVKQAEAELTQRIKETNAQYRVGLTQKIKEASAQFLEQQLGNWIENNFDLKTKEIKGRSKLVIRSQSFQGFLLLSLVRLIIFGLPFFLLFKIYPTVFLTLIARLGIASWLSFPLLIATLCGSFINLPFFILTARLSERRINFELFPLWLFKYFCLPSYRTRNQPYSSVGINVSGGLIPIVLALYQFHRAPPLAILLITAIIGGLNYFLVKVIPERAIVIRRSRFWLIATVAALLAMAVVDPGVNRTDVSVAFAGGVLGTTIGADLLHLKNVRSETAASPLIIGGAGLKDAIALCGLCTLIIAEWLPPTIIWLSALLP